MNDHDTARRLATEAGRLLLALRQDDTVADSAELRTVVIDVPTS